MPERSIIHLNVADFAVAVERTLDYRLRKRPVIIAPEGAVRAAVYDMSDEAYQQGVRKGMSLRRALRYCRDAAVLPPHSDRYERAMTQFLKHVSSYSPLIEMTDHKGHLFIDATGTGKLFGPPPDVAWRIRKTVRADMGFDPIWSVASNKLVAKVATRLVKPTGEYIVRAGDEAAFLKPLPLYLIPGIEPSDLKRLREFNLTRAGQVADLRRRRLATKRIRVVLDYSDGRRTHRQAVADPPTANDMRLFATAKRALKRAWTRRVRLRHLHLICDRLAYPSAQMELFSEHTAAQKADDNLVAALDAIRRRFGFNAVRVGRTLEPISKTI